jgi:NDP-sugar pyrophosphorylase family protein
VKAMILAAGLGTRLRPLTNDRPKALVEIGGRTLLEITLSRLSSFGIREVIINIHHFADMIRGHLAAHDNFGMQIELSHEEILLDTGGGLKRASHFFLHDSEPFVLHNVDVISTIDLHQMVHFHHSQGALATLAVQSRETSRPLLFNGGLQLCGRKIGPDQTPEIVRPSADLRPLAFSGIHIISPRLLTMMDEETVFSIIPTYLRLAQQGEQIVGFAADQYSWRDLGRPKDLDLAARDLQAPGNV